MDEELVKEQLARNIAFLGEEGVDKLRKSFVIIVGAGNGNSDGNERFSSRENTPRSGGSAFIVKIKWD